MTRQSRRTFLGRAAAAGIAGKFDPQAERFVGDPQADKLLTREYRKPFIVPEKV